MPTVFGPDGFEGSHGDPLSTYSANWHSHANELEIKNVGDGVARHLAGDTYSRLASQVVGSADYEVQAEITSGTGFVCARLQDDDDGYGVQKNTTTSLRLIKRLAASNTTLGSATVASGADVAKIRVEGTTIKGYYAGTEEISTTDSDHTTEQYAGMASFGFASGEFDDFEVISLADTTAEFMAAMAVPNPDPVRRQRMVSSY